MRNFVTLTETQYAVFRLLAGGPADVATKSDFGGRLVARRVARELERKGLVKIVHGRAELTEAGERAARQ